MRPLTNHTPKPLLKVGDKSLLWHQLQRLKYSDVSEVVINVAYLGQQIINEFGDGADLGLKISYSIEPEPLETGGAINHALSLLGESPFILINGDVWCDFPLSALNKTVLTKSTSGEMDAHLILVSNPEHNLSGDFSLDDTGLVSNESRLRRYTYSGIALMRPSIVSLYPKRREKFALKEVFDWAIARGKVSGQVHDGHWVDVGTPERLAQISADFAQQS